jgi:deaminated glutathione amidase
MSERLQIAICQMTSVDDVEVNFLQIEKLLEKVSPQSRIVFFPENCLYMRLLEGDKIAGLELDDEVFQKLSAQAVKRKLALHLGSVPLRKNDKLTNASVLIDSHGKISSTYEKLHLFDIALEGQKPIRESDAFAHGQGTSDLEIEGWKFGQSICYDVRFSELYSQYAKKSVDVILVPSAFLVSTGKAHWEILLRARAIESQCYLIASAQAGTHRSPESHSQLGERKTYGHSLVVSPWGEILAEGSADQPEVIEFCLEKSAIETVRRQIPMKSHRRL